ncbi:GFA family protein [Legionella israelensis]|uniref:GFA family protein n=2 Tax=Legionella israelensis TaxID=454 RepID=A0AAX1EDB3_9GAMM|nr:GFA family protein [Legionella israelensis]
MKMKLKGSCHCQAVRFECESHSPYPFMRCYCSICRKTAGGGGYAINIMAVADSLKVKGKKFVSIYQAILREEGKTKISSGQRHFCRNCASCLWVFDPEWPELIHPFASAIDTALPKPPEKIHMMLDSAANWCEIPEGKHDIHYAEYPPMSIEDWHRQHGLWIDQTS